jgi:signal transduction histidine kinase
MTTTLGIVWLVGSIAVVALVVLARQRRRALARQLHELRGALTAARLAVDLMPLLGIEEPSVCIAASDELERSYHSLGQFELLLHEPVVPRPHQTARWFARTAQRRYLRGSIDAHGELARLAVVWGEAARRLDRRLEFSWHGPRSGIKVNGQRREFAEVVANLLSNAIRHGEGEITISAHVTADKLRIEVRDNGPGLGRPIAALTRTRKLGPHGHGLANAVRAAQRLGGSLTSAPSVRGALLIFSVPARRSFDPLGEIDEASVADVTPLPRGQRTRNELTPDQPA